MFLALFGGWLYVMAAAVVLFIAVTTVGSAVGLAVFSAVNLGLAFALYRWINVRGSAVFSKL